jgi:hypothetical protein
MELSITKVIYLWIVISAMMVLSTASTDGNIKENKMTRSNIFKMLVAAALAIAAQFTYAGTVVEYYNPDLDNYFITGDAGEQKFIDGGSVGVWQRTGNNFPTGGPSQVCRFYGSAVGPNSHFYTADAEECAYLKSIYDPAVKSWKFESNDFQITNASNGTCHSGYFPIYRAYNNGNTRGVDSNHRITNNQAAIQEAVKRGWKDEGIVMCTSTKGVTTTTPTCPAPQVISDGACAAACKPLFIGKNGLCIAAPPTDAGITFMKDWAVLSVTNMMKSPSSFRLVGSVVFSLSSDNRIATIYFLFDAQNSFGVYLRGTAICTSKVNASGVWGNTVGETAPTCQLY